jgi:hypothetical protein
MDLHNFHHNVKAIEAKRDVKIIFSIVIIGPHDEFCSERYRLVAKYFCSPL